MQFQHPGWAWWLAAGVIAAGLARLRVGRKRGMASTVPWVFARVFRPSRLRYLPSLTLVASLVLIAVALLDPVLPYSQTEVRSQGLDIVVALDLSSSMEEPMEPAKTVIQKPGTKTRLDATKDAIRAFIRRRLDDRIGFVVFSENAYVVSPLTFDHDYLLHYIDLVDDQLLRGEGMTAIGDGLALSDFLLTRRSGATATRNKVVVIFTDGENNSGRDPLDALAEADAANIRVHVVGVDLEQEMRTKEAVRRFRGAVEGYGGKYFSAESINDLNAASRALDRLEKGMLVSQSNRHNAPVFWWFALPALACLAAAFALRAIPAFIDQT